ncbi:hypothetical protein [Paractinoplanes rishiriensis]|uniref:Uncharacterized protein n=1 Tax=Paractinoplanes rishiriensis TaxID=1050105 RepID=A0A919MV97_9ACTN|nr:hypothetical protein [Actinoplanes rishiriensis]GIE96593.1 hypothetical protein Ari01nite_40580 [Actinoplanes rishiriensis]
MGTVSKQDDPSQGNDHKRQVVTLVITLGFVVLVVVAGTAFGLSGTDIGAILAGTGALLAALIGTGIHQGRGGGNGAPRGATDGRGDR